MRKLAVFDLDGTLHHTEKALAPAIARAVSDVTGGSEPPFDRINSLYGEPLEEFCSELTGKTDGETFRLFMERVRHHQSRTIPEFGELYPGVVDMLRTLQEEGFELAMLSNAHSDYMEEVTASLGIRRFFTALRGRGEEASKTPRLRELAQGTDFTVMVGDRYHDIQAAIEVGVPAIACKYGYGSDDEHEGGIPAHSPGEIPGIIELLLRQGT